MSISAENNWKSIKDKIKGSGLYPDELWQVVEPFAENLLSCGRQNFDIPHTHGVVGWVFDLATAFNEQVLNGEVKDEDQVDIVVLITAAWLHDIGYFGQFNEVANYDQVHDKKTLHMIKGAEMAKNFLEEHASKFLASQQIDHIVRLIRVHDNLGQIKTTLQTILVEADTLGMLDVNYVQPTYKGNEALSFPMMESTRQRFDLFKTKRGKSVLPNIVKSFQKFVIQRDFSGSDPS